MLDLIAAGDRLLVLSPSAITVLEKTGGRWQPRIVVSIPAPPVRDPRGRLVASEDGLIAYLPGLTCRAQKAALTEFHCDDAAASFPMAGVDVRWTSGRNTLEANGWPPFFDAVRLGDTSFVTAADGRAMFFDSDHRPAGQADNWTASDMAAIDSACAPALLASGT